MDRRWNLVVGLWAVMLFGYGLFDKGFAYVHIPGTPLFVGELALGPILLLLVLDTRSFFGHRLVPVAALAAYCLISGIRFLQSLPAFKLDAIRDSAMWYYAAVAMLLLAWYKRTGPQQAFDRTVGFVERMIPWLLGWTPLAALAERISGQTFGPSSVLTGIPVLTHKIPNLAPLLAMTALYAWHYPSRRFSMRARLVIFTLALIDLTVVGTQTRGGFIAGVGGIMVGTAVLPRTLRVGRIAKGGLSVCLSLFLVAFALDLKVPGGRDMSVRQLSNNMLSIVGKQSEDRKDDVRGGLEANAEWRKTLWRNVIRKTFAADREIAGWGYGPNLGDELGFDNQIGNGTLRSPHNSHLSVFARLGFIGFGAWLLLWGTWLQALIRLARRRDLPDSRLPAAAAILVGMAVALHVNAYFDPAYESPQAGAWMWAVCGIGCAVLLVRREVVPWPSVAELADLPVHGAPIEGVHRLAAGVAVLRTTLRSGTPWAVDRTLQLGARLLRNRLVAAACLCAGLALTVVGTVGSYDSVAAGDRSATGAMSDYRDAIYQPVKALGQGVNPYDHVAYISQMPVDQEVPPYFPINYLPFAPLTLAPVPVASAAFLVLALGAVMATSAMVVRACRRHDRLALTMYVAAAVLLSRPGFQALQYGQAAPWVGLGLAALLVGVHRDRTALIAVAIALAWAKPSLGLPLATLLVVRGLWRGVLWGTVAAWLTWVPVVGLLLRHDTPLGLLRVMLDDLSYSADHPFGKLLGLTRVDFPATFAKVVYVALPGPLEVLIGMMVFLVTAWTIRRCADPAMAVLIAVLGTLLSLWRQPYDLILVAAPLAWVLLDQRATARDRRRRGWAALAFGPAALSWGFGHAGASLLGASEQGAARLSALTGLSTAACWLLCVIDTWRRPPADAFGPLRAQPPELSTCPQ